jgi:hypothetical protein
MHGNLLSIADENGDARLALYPCLHICMPLRLCSSSVCDNLSLRKCVLIFSQRSHWANQCHNINIQTACSICYKWMTIVWFMLLGPRTNQTSLNTVLRHVRLYIQVMYIMFFLLRYLYWFLRFCYARAHFHADSLLFRYTRLSIVYNSLVHVIAGYLLDKYFCWVSCFASPWDVAFCLSFTLSIVYR